MKVVHYTKPFFKLHPITIKNGDGKTGLFIKPHGGLWCSPLDSAYGWIDWCRGESYGDIDHEQRVILDVDMSNFVVIDSIEDMETKLIWRQVHGLFGAIDFEAMVQQGIDGIHLTEKGQIDTQWSHPRSLYGWDCETILILNERCIKEVEL
jgi:hypothetical protein